MKHLFAGAFALSLVTSTTFAAECSAVSGAQRVPLLELYTSEGCDSCPPADRWVSALPARGYDTDRLIVLAFHVDYWDRLGWPDRFAQARFSERQRMVNDRIGSRVVYTPQVILNGADYRRRSETDLAEGTRAITRAPAPAALSLTLTTAASQLTVSGKWSGADSRDAEGWLALYENNLETDVRAGENRNKRLHHDFVVRDIAGPLRGGALSHAFTIDPAWKRPDLAVAAFVQNPQSGDVLQALALKVCSGR
jgi:hypothetical protein